MRKEIPDFFWWTVVLLALFLALIIFLISLVLFGLESVQSLLKEYSGILTGIIAVIVAFFTIRRQTQNVKKQITTQLNIAEKNRFLDKKEELIFALTKSRRLVLLLYTECRRKKYQLSNDDISNFSDSIFETLNKCTFLMQEYYLATLNQHVTYLEIGNLIASLYSVTDEESKEEQHYAYLRNLDELIKIVSLDARFLQLRTEIGILKNSKKILEKHFYEFASDKKSILPNENYSGLVAITPTDSHWYMYKVLVLELSVNLFLEIQDDLFKQVQRSEYEVYVEKRSSVI